MGMKRRALYAGTFDPFTNGHKEILDRALEIFDEVTILIAVSPTKSPIFSTEKRMQMLEDVFGGDKRVNIASWEGLIAEYARKNKIGALVRGLRPTGDFENEFQMASMNNKLYPEIETVFLMTRGDHYFISSTLVREVYHHGGDIDPYVPEAIAKRLNEYRETGDDFKLKG